MLPVLTLYNTLTRAKEVFRPIDPDHVRMYVCGPTVYDYAHIGNGRAVVVFDLLFRVLRWRFAQVTYARNITDVDDKINAAAKANGESIRDLTNRTAAIFRDDMAALGALPPTVEPRATEHIEPMIAMIERLIASGHAYAADGHALFHVPSMPDYGKLSRSDRDAVLAGARVDVAPYKRDPSDFVLWKPSDADTPGWDSPWGRGRPGWHIECSAMSETHLGETFDIHGGGIDLVFPHHENEIAQSECAHGKRFVNVWMHNGFVTLNGEKMSKSLGNFITVHELLAEAPGEAIRLVLLSAHYRQPLDFSRAALAQAKAVLDRFYGALRNVADVAAVAGEVPEGIAAALSDDLNTPQAFAHLHELVGALNKADAVEQKAALKAGILAAGGVLGLLGDDPEAWFRRGADGDDTEIDAMVEARTAARKARNFAEADRLRAALQARGILLEDGAGGTSWKRA